MIFGLVCFILVLGVAYFHWVQGLFSAIISMVFAITAASIALAYHETIVTSLLGGKMADMANGMIICVLFAAVYGIGRIVFAVAGAQLRPLRGEGTPAIGMPTHELAAVTIGRTITVDGPVPSLEEPGLAVHRGYW